MNNKVTQSVYACFSTGVIHEGHMNIINEAKKYGNLIVGVLSDEACVKFDRFPTTQIEDRIEMFERLPQVNKVVIQKTTSYKDVLNELKPDYVIHGDNWKSGAQSVIRQETIEILKEWNGQLIEIPYTRNINVKKVDDITREKLAMPEYRRKRLRQLLKLRPIVKAIEVHNGITGLIAEKTVVERNGELDQFDTMWISSLCDSTAKGKPDIELVDMSSRLDTVNDVMEVTTKPIVLDGDTGGLVEHFVYNVRTLERMGVSAVIIEDKTGLKKNSLFGTEVQQTQDTVENFCHKISEAKESLRTDEFMIIARIESLILEQGMKDALNRAYAYVNAGADGIMIHSRKKDPTEIFEFCDKFRKTDKDTPIVVVPTSFNTVTEEDFITHGVNIVIYANQLTRSAFPAMQQTATKILECHRAKEVDDNLMSIKDIITLID
ncbi:phosphoenolpyruvate mutase [Clostridium botulinum]|uniref:phosphoenolpyruvate mutase n=1 Tax=Clostridium botulinum TaxID=1491 RepID=UPI0007DED461|nr:phosphoenolpyruvate mutase [Clostridium botulinum]KEI81814.1 phosphoenolpyruvate phosphomutase [Clostridium botulinum B2 331]NEZ75546.1 phosphoenolpyruvate mutase [Clostridium botulinum]NEZ99286.1 phosphoenolpyruvate mutase [Clostridium botulinum]NFA32154.1 phosphoenolpyruvate mutase [Clostridium botulinum]NFA85036.1 phosphoenolpyruvate mutase [Clostridium botulinum]